jgi:hypothetical protein
MQKKPSRKNAAKKPPAKQARKPSTGKSARSIASAKSGAAKAVKIMDALIKKYGKVAHPLAYQSPYQLLVMVVLSAQTNDALINRIAPQFFAQLQGPCKPAQTQTRRSI